MPVCSFDGQWSRITVRDQEDDDPLTILQLQKVVYQNVKKRPVSQLLSAITDRSVVRCMCFEEVSEIVEITRTSGKIVVGEQTRKRPHTDLFKNYENDQGLGRW